MLVIPLNLMITIALDLGLAFFFRKYQNYVKKKALIFFKQIMQKVSTYQKIMRDVLKLWRNIQQWSRKRQ